MLVFITDLTLLKPIAQLSTPDRKEFLKNETEVAHKISEIAQYLGFSHTMSTNKFKTVHSLLEDLGMEG